MPLTPTAATLITEILMRELGKVLTINKGEHYSKVEEIIYRVSKKYTQSTPTEEQIKEHAQDINDMKLLPGEVVQHEGKKFIESSRVVEMVAAFARSQVEKTLHKTYTDIELKSEAEKEYPLRNVENITGPARVELWNYNATKKGEQNAYIKGAKRLSK